MKLSVAIPVVFKLSFSIAVGMVEIRLPLIDMSIAEKGENSGVLHVHDTVRRPLNIHRICRMNENSAQTANASAHVERMQKSLESQPQWIYPKVFLNTPSTAFSFPDYPGLSVGLRYYIIVGKIGWWITIALIALYNIAIAIYSVGLGLIISLPVSFVFLLIMNLALALQFASCELIAVFLKMEGHLAYISGRQKRSRSRDR